VGNDTFGESNIENLQKSGVEVSQVQKSDSSHTATATITVNAHGENTIVVTLGANMELDDDCAERHEKAIKEAGMVMTQQEVSRKGNKRAFELAKKHGVKTFFNPAPGERDTDMSMVALSDIICTNENEKFIDYCSGVLLASKGKQGIEHIPVKKVKAVDTT
ncbi:hypothetical protein TELCIR_20816, partial [Teladorsagia circumcincta]